MPEASPEISSGKDKEPKEKKETKEKKSSWALMTVTLTLVISFTLSVFSSTTLSDVDVMVALALLLMFILIGIIFDVIGTAVTAAVIPPFHSMASRRVAGATVAIKLIGSADKVANFCNDVVGDIAGVISGATTAVIVAAFFAGGGILPSALMTALVAAMTVGGKALGKGFAIKKCNEIVFFVAKILYTTRRIMGIKDK